MHSNLHRVEFGIFVQFAGNKHLTSLGITLCPNQLLQPIYFWQGYSLPQYLHSVERWCINAEIQLNQMEWRHTWRSTVGQFTVTVIGKTVSSETLHSKLLIYVFGIHFVHQFFNAAITPFAWLNYMFVFSFGVNLLILVVRNWASQKMGHACLSAAVKWYFRFLFHFSTFSPHWKVNRIIFDFRDFVSLIFTSWNENDTLQDFAYKSVLFFTAIAPNKFHIFTYKNIHTASKITR